MDKLEFNKEVQYQLTMKYVRDLKNSGVFSEEEYAQIDAMMLEKHKPILGRLLSGKPLT